MWRWARSARRSREADGHEVAFDFGTVGALQAKLDAGETADVVILSVPGIDKLEKAGALVPGSRQNVAKTFIARLHPRRRAAAGFFHRRGVQAPAGERPRHRHQRSGGRRLGRRLLAKSCSSDWAGRR